MSEHEPRVDWGVGAVGERVRCAECGEYVAFSLLGKLCHTTLALIVKAEVATQARIRAKQALRDAQDAEDAARRAMTGGVL